MNLFPIFQMVHSAIKCGDIEQVVTDPQQIDPNIFMVSRDAVKYDGKKVFFYQNITHIYVNFITVNPTNYNIESIESP
jgi:hypothetical protein